MLTTIDCGVVAAKVEGADDEEEADDAPESIAQQGQPGKIAEFGGGKSCPL